MTAAERDPAYEGATDWPALVARMSPDEMDGWVEEAITGSEIDCQAAARPLLGVIQREYRRANRWELRALNAEAKADRLEAECAALADALGNPVLTHDFEFNGADGRCGAYVQRFGSRYRCGGITRQSPVHRTPAVVRAELEKVRDQALYRCPVCEHAAPWTDGTIRAAGDPESEFWCQTCGAESPLSSCAVVRAELEGQ